MVTSFLSTGAAALAAMLVANVLGAKGAGVFALARVVPTVVAAVLGAGVTMSNAYLVGGRRYSIQAITEASMSLALIIGFIGWRLDRRRQHRARALLQLALRDGGA